MTIDGNLLVQGKEPRKQYVQSLIPFVYGTDLPIITSYGEFSHHVAKCVGGGGTTYT